MQVPESPLVESMNRLLRVFHRSALDSSQENIHDLRVALRRCRTLAGCLSEFRPNPLLRKVSRESKKLFQGLAGLRELHVRIEWVIRLLPARDAAARQRLKELRSREQKINSRIDRILDDFDVAHWKQLRDRIESRRLDRDLKMKQAARISLERLRECQKLHRQAMGTLQEKNWHRLRIAFKRFRYFTAEFLPVKSQPAESELKRIQDDLGEANDLAELRIYLCRYFGKPAAVPQTWQRKIIREREKRLQEYGRFQSGNRRFKKWAEKISLLTG